MGNSWDIAGRAEQQGIGNLESIKDFYSAGPPLSRQGTLMDMVQIKEEMTRDMKADSSLRQSDYDVIQEFKILRKARKANSRIKILDFKAAVLASSGNW